MILCIPLRQELMPRQNIFDLICQDQEMRIQAQEDNVCPDFIVQYYRIFLINEKFQAPCKRTQHCWVFHFTSVCRPCCMLLRVTAPFALHCKTRTQQHATVLSLLLVQQCWGQCCFRLQVTLEIAPFQSGDDQGIASRYSTVITDLPSKNK